MADQQGSTTIGFRLDQDQLGRLEAYKTPADKSLHDVARRLLLDRMSMLTMDEMRLELAESRREIQLFRKEFIGVSKRLMLMTEKEPEARIETWFKRNIGGD